MSDNKMMSVGVMKICSGNMEGKEYYFRDGQVMKVGRSANCDIRLDESYTHVSREHCSIAYDGQRGRFYVVDTSSKGVFNKDAQRLKGEGYIPADYTLYLAGKGCKLAFSVTEADMAIGWEERKAAPAPETGTPAYPGAGSIPNQPPQKSVQPVRYKQPVTPQVSASAAKSSSAGLLIAAAIGGIILIGLIVVGVIFLSGKKKDTASSSEIAQSENASSQTPDPQEDSSSETEKPEDKKPEGKEPEDKKPAKPDSDDQSNEPKAVSKEDLRKAIDTYTNDEMLQDPFTADFDGDGQLEMVAEFIEPYSANGFELCQQYFVYTNGTKTYRFDGETGSVLYESTYYAIKIDKGCHFALTTNWRVEALGGQMYTSEIYGLSPNGATSYFSKEFCSLSDPRPGVINVTLYVEPSPGSEFLAECDWKWNGTGYSPDDVELNPDLDCDISDGLYGVSDILDEATYEHFDVLDYMYVDTGKGVFNVASTLEQYDPKTWDSIGRIEYAERSFKLSSGFKIYTMQEDGAYEYNINEFNDWFGKKDHQRSGMFFSFFIENGELSKIEIRS